MSNIINGKKIARLIRQDLKQQVSHLPGKPGLAIILIGHDPGSHVYVGLKEKAAKQAGIYFEKYLFPTTVSEAEVLVLIQDLNIRPEINGIVIQYPLPKGFSKKNVITALSPVKDVDGFHPENIKALLAGQPGIVPGLAAGILKLIESTGVTLAGKKALVIANSKIFSQPLGYLLKQKRVELSACNPDKSDCSGLSKEADILIVAIGQPGLIKKEAVKKGAVVIDVGYNRVNGQAVGDVDFESVKQEAGWLSPVPGGVGPMTVAMLLKNVVKAYEIQAG